jgi:hypothetical protein
MRVFRLPEMHLGLAASLFLILIAVAYNFAIALPAVALGRGCAASDPLLAGLASLS